MKYCCINCFNNEYLKGYIQKNNKKGYYNYCNSKNVNIVSTRLLGDYIRECLDKKIYLATDYTDMRKSIDGLVAIIQQQFKLDSFQLALFLFCGKMCDRLKALL